MQPDHGDWTTHEGIADTFSKAITNDGVAFMLHTEHAKAVVAVWDSDIHDYAVHSSAYPTYRDLCAKRFIVPHAAVVDKQVRRLANGRGAALRVTKYFAAAVLALREAAFQQQVRQHQQERMGGD